MSKFNKIQELAKQYVKEGHIAPESGEKFVAKAWKFVQKFAKNIKV